MIFYSVRTVAYVSRSQSAIIPRTLVSDIFVSSNPGVSTKITLCVPVVILIGCTFEVHDSRLWPMRSLLAFLQA